MEAVKKFKSLIDKKRPKARAGALGHDIRTLHPSPSGNVTSEPLLHKSRSVDMHDRRSVEQALATEGVHHDLNSLSSDPILPERVDSTVTMIDPARQDSQDTNKPHHVGHRLHTEDVPTIQHPESYSGNSGERGHAHDPMNEQPLFLGIGTGGIESLEPPEQEIVAESPTAAEFSIYDTAYQEEVERIREAQGRRATVYLTRRVDAKKEYKADENMVDAPKQSEIRGLPHEGFKNLLDRAREKSDEPPLGKSGLGHNFNDIASRAMENTRLMGKDLSDRSSTVLDTVIEKGKEIAARKDAGS